jgi:hypothetical protein
MHKISFIDLKSGLSWAHNPSSPHKEMPHEFWTDYLFSVDGIPSHLRVSSMRKPLQWQLQGQKFFMLGSVSIHGFRTTYLSRKPERYPSMLACSSKQTLSHGLPREDLPKHISQCQSSQGLENLLRLRSSPHKYSQTSLCKGQLRARAGTDDICIGFHNNRSMPFFVPMGQVPQKKGSSETAYPIGSSWKHTRYDLHNPREIPRCKDSRRLDNRTRRNLCIGSGIHGLCPSSQDSAVIGILRYSRKDQLRFQTSILSQCIQEHWNTVRSDHSSYGLLLKKGLPREVEAHSLTRPRNWETSHLLNQQLQTTCEDNNRSLSMSMAG